MYIVCNQSGERITDHPEIEEATRLMRLIPAAFEVVSAATGKLMAYKPRVSKAELVSLLRGAA